MTECSEHLQRLEDAVRGARAALDARAPLAVVPFDAPPPPDGPLDARDHGRARALAAELLELLERLADAQRAVGDELASVHRPRTDRAALPAARYFDGYG